MSETILANVSTPIAKIIDNIGPIIAPLLRPGTLPTSVLAVCLNKILPTLKEDPLFISGDNSVRKRRAEMTTKVEEKSDVVNKVEEKLAVGEQGLRQKTKTKSDLFTKDDEEMLRNFDFYHGFLPREDLPSLLKQVGDYLLRVSEVNNDSTIIQRDIILSILTEYNTDKSVEGRSFMGGVKTGKLKNLVIKRQGSKYLIEWNRAFDTLCELIEFYKINTLQLNKFTVILKNPIKLQSWEYLHSDVKEGVLLGKGAFGEVRAGTLQLKTGEIIEVAIKTTKCSSDLCKAKIKEMMREARLMRNFNHKNIVGIYGVAVDKQPLYILLELVSGGSLQSFLKANVGKIDVREKIKLCLGAAQGVAYLHSQRCMHRDLAARNCLITNDRVVKVGDFGLSLIGTTYVIRTRTRLPIKWLAPEVISTLTFSLKSDVFSFGVMVYEIFSDGDEPWKGKTNGEVKAAVTNGECVQLPSCCPESLRNFIATRLFANNPEIRADMIEVVETFQRAYSESRTFHMRRKFASFMQDVSSSNLYASRVLRVDMLDSHARIVTATSKPLPLRTCARCEPGGVHCQLFKLPPRCFHSGHKIVFSFR